MTAIDVRPDGLTDPRVHALLRVHLAGMRSSSPACSVHALDLSDLRQPSVRFFAAWEGEDLLGFGALKQLSEAEGEIKSMRTDERHLGRGVAARVLERLLDEARTLGLTRVSLETGTGPAFDAAHRLYARFGFEPCGPFGTYPLDDPFSVFFTRSVD